MREYQLKNPFFLVLDSEIPSPDFETDDFFILKVSFILSLASMNYLKIELFLIS